MLKQIESGLIPVYESEKGNHLVNARELHEFLEVDTRYNDWIKSRIEKYEFVEGTDYTTLTENLVNGGRQNIHIFKLEPAKEIAMVENNEKGKQIRKYFIQVEEKYKQQLQPQSVEDLIIMQAQSMKELRGEVKQLQATTQVIKETIITQPDNWREEINRSLNKISLAIGPNQFQDVRRDSYKLLDQRAGVDLERRLENLRVRLMKQGKGATAIKNANKLDCIEEDKKLREIYGKIVNEYSIKFCA